MQREETDARAAGEGGWGGVPEVCLQAKAAPLAQNSPQCIFQKLSGKYPKVQELLLGNRARCYLLPAPERQWVNKGQASPGGGKCSRGGDLPDIASQLWPSFSQPQAPEPKESLSQTQKMISPTSSGPTSRMC